MENSRRALNGNGGMNMKYKSIEFKPMKFKPFLQLDIQRFADGGEGGGSGEGAGDAGTGAEGGAGEGTGKVEFTPEQQAELDRILGERLGKAQAKWEKDYQSKLEAAKTEAEKLAKMNADQKAEYERQKKEEELTKRESEITRRELRASALETLAEKGLPKQLADILVFTDAETTNKSLEAVEKAFREAVESGVNERLKGDPPKGGGSKGVTESVGANFAKSLNEKNKPIETTLWG